MGIYLQAVDGPDVNSPDYVGTFGNSQSLVILTLIEYYEKFAAESNDAVALKMLADAKKQEQDEYHQTARITHDIAWILTINNSAPKDAYEFRKYAIDRGVDQWLNVTDYDDDHVAHVRQVITKIAEYGQDVYET